MISRVLLSFALSVSFLPTVTGQQPQPRQSPDPQKTTSTQQQNPPDVEPQDVVRITSYLVQVDAVVTPSAPQQKKEGDEISSGPALRQFSQGSRILFGYSIYNAQIDPSTHLPG